MSAHVVDRFVRAAWPDWPTARDLPRGRFHASPEVARMLIDHCRRFPNVAGKGKIFGRPVIADPGVPRGGVIFVAVIDPDEPSVLPARG